MRRRVSQFAGIGLILALTGCTGIFGRQGLPPDPLFANRKPIEAKAKAGPPTAPAFSEPTPAANPYFAERTRGKGPAVHGE